METGCTFRVICTATKTVNSNNVIGFPELTVEHFYVRFAVVFEISCRKQTDIHTDRQTDKSH